MVNQDERKIIIDMHLIEKNIKNEKTMNYRKTEILFMDKLGK